MNSLALVPTSSNASDCNSRGPARGDPSVLPLGAVPAKPSRGHGAASNGRDSAASQPAAPAPHRTLPPADGCPSTLPPPPPGPPVMVMFPATLPLAIFFVPPPGETLVAGVLGLMVLLSSWKWDWGQVSSSGVFSGLAAGAAVGLGVRSRPVGGWSCVTLSALGIALLGGGRASFSLATLLALSTLWRHGWWLYLQPATALVVLVLLGSTADVGLGFLVASLVQVHRTQPPVPLRQSSSLQSPDTSAQPRRPGAEEWEAVTPPGLGGVRGRTRM